MQQYVALLRAIAPSGRNMTNDKLRGVLERLDPHTRVVRYDAPARAVLAVTVNSAAGTAPSFVSWLESSFGTDITMRSWLTVRRIVDRLDH